MAAVCVVMFMASLLHWVLNLQWKFRYAGAVHRLTGVATSWIESIYGQTLGATQGSGESRKLSLDTFGKAITKRHLDVLTAGTSVLVLVNVSMSIAFS